MNAGIFIGMVIGAAAGSGLAALTGVFWCFPIGVVVGGGVVAGLDYKEA